MLSTGGRCCQQERCFADKNKVLSKGAKLCRQKKQSWRLSQLCFVNRSNVDRSKMLSAEALFYRQEHPWRLFQQLGRPGGPIWAALEPVWPAWGPFETATRQCFVDRSNVDRSKVLPTGAMFCRQEQPWRSFQQLGRPGKSFWAAWGPVWPAWGPGKPVWAAWASFPALQAWVP